MVIQSNFEVTPEAFIDQGMESKKYIVVKNHVREIVKEDYGSKVDEINTIDGEKSQKKSKKDKEQKQKPSRSDNVNSNEICKSDLEELKSVYKKCKNVIRQIESKYGHLLELDNENEYSNKRKREKDSTDNCNCTLNKKIIFNDDGQQVFHENNDIENHTCPKKLRNDKKYYSETYQSIQIEEENFDNLPENIEGLSEILKNPSISRHLRFVVIEKIKYIRQENLNMIRFDRSKLIQKLKSNPEEIIGFIGTNISTLAGYPTQ